MFVTSIYAHNEGSVLCLSLFRVLYLSLVRTTRWYCTVMCYVCRQYAQHMGTVISCLVVVTRTGNMLELCYHVLLFSPVRTTRGNYVIMCSVCQPYTKHVGTVSSCYVVPIKHITRELCLFCLCFVCKVLVTSMHKRLAPCMVM